MGNKKLTIEFIKSEFAKENYQLLTTEYKNSFQKLDYICPNKHRHSIRWCHWIQGIGCPYCSGKAKLNIDFIKSEFEKEGYHLLEIKYKNNNQKLNYICLNGHHHSITWSNWLRGNRCPHCAGLAKPTIDFIRSEFEKKGYKLLSTEYKNNKQKLSYICPNGHQHSITLNSWQHGNRCPYCSNNVKLVIDFIKSEFAKEGYQLLTTEYKNGKQKLDYICHNGHCHSIMWNSWQQGKRCPTCANINNSGPNNINWKGGISFEPYCQIWKDAEYKSDIKLRDGNQCLNPYCDSKNHRDLTIHHIDYNKKNCAPQNLITVCRSCNARANYDRKWHTAWYRNILTKRYGYKYQAGSV